MLAFYTSRYDHENLVAMRCAIIAAQRHLSCDATTCRTCEHFECCSDLNRLERYIDRKLNEMEDSAKCGT